MHYHARRAPLAVVLLFTLPLACGRSPSLPPAEYEAALRAFHTGLAQLDVGLLTDAIDAFGTVTTVAPDEPAGWGNLALAHIRLGDFAAAEVPLAQAVRLASEDSGVALLQGRMLALGLGQVDAGVVELRRAVSLDPTNLRARFSLAQEIERSQVDDADAEAKAVLEDTLALAPDNLAVMVERVRLAAKLGDVEALREAAGTLGRLESGWPALARTQYLALQEAVEAGDTAAAASPAARLRNVLVSTPAFQDDLAAVATAVELMAEPFRTFLVLPPSRATPAVPDLTVAFDAAPFDPALASSEGTWRAAVVLTTDESGPVVVGADGGGLRRLDETGLQVSLGATAPVLASTHGLLALDWVADFRPDFVVAGRGGLRLLVRNDDGSLDDRTEGASATEDGGEAAAVVGADTFGVWSADVEMDGDLDLVAGAMTGAPAVLRNNGDGTWRVLRPFAGVDGLRGFAWGDLDRDGDPDAALLDADGLVHVFVNGQAGAFEEVDTGSLSANVTALALGDPDADGWFDLVTLHGDGTIRRRHLGTDGWGEDDLASWTGMAPVPVGVARLLLADVDNSGAVDLVASAPSGSAVWLSDESLALVRLETDVPAQVLDVADLDGDGRLDLVGLADGQPYRALGRGDRAYHWQVMRPRAQLVAGDQRVNTFGVGGEIEVRAGRLVQKHPLDGGVVHIGLGEHTGIDVARVVWPNGIMQAEFGRAIDQVILVEQRLKGSCPWVFAYDGSGMQFVTDFLWRSPLGLRVNAQDTAGVTQTEDWVRIRGDQLVPRDGLYDVRITAELWETHFVDHVALLAVDHPPDVEVYVDERFAAEAPALATRVTSRPVPVPRAWDQAGRDVTDVVAARDQRYLSGFARGPYQGLAAEHWVELAIDGHPDWLVAHGWVYPTDSSINVALAQGRHPRPHGLALDAQDPAGRWVTIEPDLGFPAGKNKTVLIALADLWRTVPTASRVRLRTNLEVYWDALAVAEDRRDVEVTTVRLAPREAVLQYRGFSRTDYARDRPETPVYAELANVTPRWRDLAGFYTRFGDVGPLLDTVDDRYVIMNAGDELQLQFAAPEPREGMARDFVLVGDGWVKDGDFNTGYSKTVHPLPEHGRPDYVAAADPATLETDPVYQRHADDWQTFHTRYVTPRRYLAGLR